MNVFIRLVRVMEHGKLGQKKRPYFYGQHVLIISVMPLLEINVLLFQLIVILSERRNHMYDGIDDIEDEVKQNARDQQHPVLTNQTFPEVLRGAAFSLSSEPKWDIPTEGVAVISAPLPDFKPVPGLSHRQVELIHNIDNELPEQGRARQQRLLTINNDIASIECFLPGLEIVRAFLDTMPTNDDAYLVEAKKMADMKLRSFIVEVGERLTSLQRELEIKRVVK